MTTAIKTTKHFNLCDLYIGLIIVFNLQDIVYPSGIIAQSIQLVTMLWGVIYAIPLMFKYPQLPLILKATTLLVIMYCLYGLTEMLFPRGIYLGDELRPTYYYLKYALNSFLPIFVFYTFYKKGFLTARRIELYAYVYLALFIVIFFHNLSTMREKALLFGSNREEFTNNTSYSFAYLIPFLFFIRKTIIRYAMLATVASFILMGMKRGAIIIGVIGIVWFLYCQIKDTRNKKTQHWAIILSIAFIIAGIVYIQYTLATSDYFIQRIEQTKEGNSSHRDVLYSTLLYEINTDTSLIHFIFGRGADSSILISGNYAHQDWLELMTNNGLLGVCLGIFFYYSIFRTAYKIRWELGKLYYNIFLLVGVIALVPTFFSMIIYQMPSTLSLMIAFMAGHSEHANRGIKTRIKSHKTLTPLAYK